MPEWLWGSGEMVERIRAHNWATTPLGPVEGWPDRLKGAVEQMLAAPQLASMAIGPERIFIYNDEAAAHYGSRHPGALGRPLPHVFAHEFHAVAGFYDRVFAGESLHIPAQPLDPDETGTPEAFDAWLTPIRDQAGEVIAAVMNGVAAGGRARVNMALQRNQRWLSGQNEAFRAAVNGAPLEDSLGRLIVTAVAQVDGGARGAFYVVNEDGATLRHVVGMPDLYARAVDGFKIGQESLACGLAVSMAEPVITADVREEPRWAPWLGLAGEHGYRGCWSFPVETVAGRLVGTFVLYFPEPRAPSVADLDLARSLTGTASIIIDGQRSREALERNDARQAFLLRLADALRPVADPVAVQEIAIRMLGEELAVDRSYYAEFDWPGDVLHIHHEYVRSGAVSAVGAHPISAFEDLLQFSHDGAPLVCDAIALHPIFKTEIAAYRERGTDGFILMPLVKEGCMVACMCVTMEVPRAWSPAEVALVGDVAERTWASVERARVEAALHASEEKYRSLFDTIDEGFVIGDFAFDEEGQPINFRYLDLNPALERQAGLKVADLKGRWITDILPPEEARYWIGAFGSVLRSGRPARFEHYLGSLDRWFGVNVTPYGRNRIATMYENITERKRGEAARHESEQRQAFLLKLSDALRPLIDPDEIQRAPARLTGQHLGIEHAHYTPVETVGDALHHVARLGDPAPGRPSVAGPYRLADVPGVTEVLVSGRVMSVPDVANDPRLESADKAAYAAADVANFLQTPLVKGDDLVATFAVHGPSPRAWTEADAMLLSEVAERTWTAVERGRAELAMRDSEQRLALAFATLPVGIAIIDQSGGTIMANREMERFLPTGSIPSREFGRVARWKGWDAEGRLIPPEAFPGARALQGHGVSPGLQMLYVEDAGREIWTEVSSATLRDQDGGITGAIVVVVDVDRVKRSEETAQASEERLRQFGEASQDVLWIRDAKALQLQYLTPAFEAIFGVSREEALAGDTYRSWQDLIVPDDRELAARSIGRVRNGEHVTFDYRIRRPRDGAIRWVRNTDFPIVDSNGAVALIGGIGHDFTELRETELRLQTLVEGIPQLVWRAVDGGEWTWASPQWTHFTGLSEADSLGNGWLDALHPDDRQAAQDAWAQAMEAGGFEVEYRLRCAPEHEFRWFQTRATPVRDEAGEIIEWLGTSTDVHELRELQERQRVLVAELQHRTRNLMGVVRATARRTGEASTDLADFQDRFNDRLEALARVQGLLSRLNETDRIAFDELIRSELAAMNGTDERVTLIGPAGIKLRSSMVQTLAMALHELATNALKYGALAQSGARLAIQWRMEAPDRSGRPRLHIVWHESGVSMPPIGAAPQGGGQGRELIEEALPYQLDAETSFELGADGVRCTITIPVSTRNVAELADA